MDTKTNRQTTAAFLFLMGIVVLIAFIMNSCTNVPIPKDLGAYDAERQAYIDNIIKECQEDTAKWNQFLECSKYEGDAGCDSCFEAVYGFPIPE